MSDIHLSCVKCGKPATKEHHKPPDRESKGMGGTSDPDVETWRVPLCRACHRSLHAKEWYLEVVDGIARGWESKDRKKFLFVRVFEPIEVCLSLTSYPDEILRKREMLSALTDENLAYFVAMSVKASKTNILNIGIAADVFHERYSQYGEGWYKECAKYVSRINQEGQTVSEREIYRAHAVYLAFREDPHALEWMPKSLAAACAESKNPQEAIAFCNETMDAGRRPRVREVREKFGNADIVEVTYCECNNCGDVHPRRSQ